MLGQAAAITGEYAVAAQHQNRTTIMETALARGDHFFVWRQHNRVPFQHHAIDLGDGTVVHFTDGECGVAGPGIAGPGGATTDFEIQRTSLDGVTRHGRDATHVVTHRNRLSPELVVERALSQVGRRGYHLIFDNCEHFASWCVADRDESHQIDVACERLSAAGVKAIAVGTVRFASNVGTKHLLRGVSPWMLISDAAQWITEAGGHHVGLRDPDRRKHAGRAVGFTTALGVGVCAGPGGLAVAGGIWVAGEFASVMSRATYEQVRQHRGGRKHSVDQTNPTRITA